MWAPGYTHAVSNLGWPIDATAEHEAAVAEVASDPEARRHLRWQIEAGFFTKGWAKRQLDLVDDWAKRWGCRIYLGEFGVYAKPAPRQARLDYSRFYREESERRGWGWAIWDDAGGFPVVKREGDHRVADRELLAALGL